MGDDKLDRVTRGACPNGWPPGFCLLLEDVAAHEANRFPRPNQADPVPVRFRKPLRDTVLPLLGNDMFSSNRRSMISSLTSPLSASVFPRPVFDPCHNLGNIAETSKLLSISLELPSLHPLRRIYG